MNLIDLILGAAREPASSSRLPSASTSGMPGPGDAVTALLSRLGGRASADVGMPAADMPLPRAPRSTEAAQPGATIQDTVVTEAAPSGRFNGLISTMTGDVPTGRRIGAALAGGLGTMDARMPLGAFGQGAGGALKGSTGFDATAFDRNVRANDALRKANESDATIGYTNARTGLVRRQVAALDNDEGSSSNLPRTLAEMPRSRRLIEAEKLIDRSRMRTERAIEALGTNFRLTDEQRAKETKRLRGLHGDYEGRIRRELGVGETDAPAAAPPAGGQGKPGEIRMKGQGTKDVPYSPATAADYAEIPSGAYYVHPAFSRKPQAFWYWRE